MNEIIKFTDYKRINEDVIIPVVDVVIGNSGALKYRNGLPLKGTVNLESSYVLDEEGNKVPAAFTNATKKRGLTGSVGNKTQMVPSSILGQDGNNYPGGLDKNGKLVGIHFDENGNLLTGTQSEKGSKKIRLPNTIVDILSTSLVKTEDLKYWNKKIDYIKCLLDVAITPTGWVNVKVDMEVIKRVRRYSNGLVNPDKVSDNSHEAFISKLKVLSEISNKDKNIVANNIDRSEIQKQMSAIILLHYVNEIKTFFTPSTSGLLFESFLGGLIPFAKVTEDNGKADISVPSTGGNTDYQVKLYSENSSNVGIALRATAKEGDIISEFPNGEIPLDYYLICIKRGDMIDIYILNDDSTSPCFYHKFRSGYKKDKPDETYTSNTFSLSLLKNSTVPELKYTLNLSDLEGKINIIGKGIKRNLDFLYKQLSQFQYNVETIITGVDEKSQKIIDDNKFQIISKNAEENLTQMTKVLTKLVSGISKPRR